MAVKFTSGLAKRPTFAIFTATLPEFAVKVAPVARIIDEQLAGKRRCGLSEEPENKRDEK
jgi:hypothetical protein